MEHRTRVPIVYNRTPICVHVILIDLAGDVACMASILARNPKVYVEADLAVLCIQPVSKENYIAATRALDVFKRKCEPTGINI
jgi:hypothetical protein